MLFDQPAQQQQQLAQRRPSTCAPGRVFDTAQTPSTFYSNSAPSSTIGFHPSRPPVPLFNQSSGHVPQNIAQSAAMTGISPSALSDSDDLVLTPLATDFDAHFDFGRLDGTADMTWDDTAAATFTAINAGGAVSVQTVSPKDIFSSDGLGSAPPSSAFTNLTSPDINDSPFPDSYDTSPMFHGNGDVHGADDWFPLFSDAMSEEQPVAQHMQRDLSTNTLSGHTDSSGNSPLISLDQSGRRKSSPVSLGQSLQRHSSSSGVNRRRRQRPLPPIEVDSGDKIALKRARNTLAARDSRQRKLEHVVTLESRIADLEEQLKACKDALATRGYSGPLLQQ